MITKILEGEREFVPFTLTVETEEEALALWHMTNCKVDRPLKRYMQGEDGMSASTMASLKGEIHSAVNNVYPLRKIEDTEENDE